MPDSTPVCRRCGRCCELGGPGLLRDDAPLLSSGALRPEMLVCLRRGQWARQDGMGGGLAQLGNEMLKLAGTGRAPHPWQCLAYAPGTGCTIYDRRPVQCGVLFCADTRPLEALLREVPALDRRAAIALLPLPEARRRLWEELAQAHEEACDVHRYFVLLDTGDREAAAARAFELAEGEKSVVLLLAKGHEAYQLTRDGFVPCTSDCELARRGVAAHDKRHLA